MVHGAVNVDSAVNNVLKIVWMCGVKDKNESSPISVVNGQAQSLIRGVV